VDPASKPARIKQLSSKPLADLTDVEFEVRSDTDWFLGKLRRSTIIEIDMGKTRLTLYSYYPLKSRNKNNGLNGRRID